MLASWKKSYDKPRQLIKKQRHHFVDKGTHSQSYGFSSSCVWIWVLDHKEDWALKNWCLQTVLLEKTLESPLDTRRSNLSMLKRKSTLNNHWKDWCWTWSSIILATWYGSPLIGKDPDAGKDWGQEEKGTTDDETVEWHYQFNGYKFEQTPGDSEGQGSLGCCSPWGCKESDTAEPLNSNKWRC